MKLHGFYGYPARDKPTIGGKPRIDPVARSIARHIRMGSFRRAYLGDEGPHFIDILDPRSFLHATRYIYPMWADYADRLLHILGGQPARKGDLSLPRDWGRKLPIKRVTCPAGEPRQGGVRSLSALSCAYPIAGSGEGHGVGSMASGEALESTRSAPPELVVVDAGEVLSYIVAD